MEKMTIRRCVLLLVYIGLVLAVFLPACAGPAATTPSTGAPQNVELTVLGFRAGTAQQLRADAIAEILRTEYPSWTVASIMAGGESQVISKRIEGKADLFFSMFPREFEIEAHGPLHPEIDFAKATEYSAVLPLTNRPLHLVVMGKTGLTSIRDIVDKKYPFTAGIGTGVARLLFGRIMGYYGTSLTGTEALGAKYEPVVIVVQEGVEALETGRINMGFSWAAIPSPVLLGVNFNLKLLPIDDPGLVQMFEKLGYDKVVIPAGTYPFVTSDVSSVTDYEFLTVRPDLPEDVVYYALKALFKHKDMLIASTANIAVQITPEAIARSLQSVEKTGVSVHPGALKFYREMGWIK
jgi:uncharacterized protein